MACVVHTNSLSSVGSNGSAKCTGPYCTTGSSTQCKYNPVCTSAHRSQRSGCSYDTGKLRCPGYINGSTVCNNAEAAGIGSRPAKIYCPLAKTRRIKFGNESF